MDDRERFMKRALQLARRGAGRVSPNPLVGAVLVRDGVIVGEGYHIYDLVDHAEVIAIRQAGDKSRGSVLYVNLEPCCHVGRTAPCVEAVLAAGVKRVSLAVRDPNPLVAGRSVAILRERGVEVEEGLCRSEALALNEKFFQFIRTGRPFTLLKLALTLDGRIATQSGESRWITGEAARRRVHRLRYEYDAVLVGVNTVLRDDPRLDCRVRRPKKLTRVVLDTRLKTPPSARLFDHHGPVVILHGREVDPQRVSALQPKAYLIAVESDSRGLDWPGILSALVSQGMTSVMVEGGGRVAASALRAGAIQKVCFFYGPKIVGSEGVPGVGALAIPSLAAALGVVDLRVRAVGGDICLVGYLSSPNPSVQSRG
jgi:diaminohydroxyphosphoribosylaminopyrimidine deaminase/5-amino-6-(5-phosphoribosylamino)uracil reductase